MSAPTPDTFFGGGAEIEEGAVPRDHNDRPMIKPLPGDEGDAYKSGPHKGLIPYSRASSFGQTIEDITNLVKWQKRQVARGTALRFDRGELRPGPRGGLPLDPSIEPSTQHEKRTWDEVAKQAEDAVGSYAKADIGTAIHLGTELADTGKPFDHLAPLVVERTRAYVRFRDEIGFKPTSVEVFGVEDEHRVAGTWDRTGYLFRSHIIGDVKTGSTMDFAGIGFAVQLATYAHAARYDATTGERIPHEDISLEEAWIFHVDRNEGGPVELYRVDIATGWRYARLVNEVKKARSVGTKAITEWTPRMVRLSQATTRADLTAAMADGEPTKREREFANALWAVLR